MTCYVSRMNIEFHYYMTYLIAVRAGFTPAEAVTIAKAAQEIDDNHIPISVSSGTSAAYMSTLSQTMNILHPHHASRIYPVFHFIPGDPDVPAARRRDGARSPWVTTPNSRLANTMLDTALISGDLYRIGASAHAYADTWAHQNFLGRDDGLNEMPGGGVAEVLADRVALLRIGHALAGHQPDIPDLIWRDERLVNPVVTNVDRFMDAAAQLFKRFHKFKTGSIVPDSDLDLNSLIADLRADIGSPTTNSAPSEQRVGRYKLRSLESPYGGVAMPEYRQGEWADAAFVEQHADLVIRIEEYIAEHAGVAGDILAFGTRMPVSWKEPLHYRETEWYRFQEAVKAHLEECWALLKSLFPDISS